MNSDFYTGTGDSQGLYGNSVTFGGTYFQWVIYYVSLTAPSTPTGGSWNFTTNTGTPPTGWSTTPPNSPSSTVWVSVSIISSLVNSPTISWSTPGNLSGLNLNTNGNLLIGTSTDAFYGTSNLSISSLASNGQNLITFSALNTVYQLPNSKSNFGGLIVVKDKTSGGSAVYLYDANYGSATTISSSFQSGITLSFTSTGSPNYYLSVQQTAGTVGHSFSFMPIDAN
jgi:hypothetical protein